MSCCKESPGLEELAAKVAEISLLHVQASVAAGEAIMRRDDLMEELQKAQRQLDKAVRAKVDAYREKPQTEHWQAQEFGSTSGIAVF